MDVYNWFAEFANRFASALFWLLLLATACGIATIFLSNNMSKNGGDDLATRTNSRWRTVTILEYLGVGWAVFVVINAIPAPNFDVKEKIVEVEKVVNRQVTYQETYDSCRARVSDDKTCHQRALLMAIPNIKIWEIHTIRTVTKRDPYSEFFEKCVDGIPISDNNTGVNERGQTIYATQLRVIRNDKCHAQAKEASSRPPEKMAEKANKVLVKEI